MEVKDILKGIHDETEGGTYVGATLSSNGYVFNFAQYSTLEEWSEPSGVSAPREYTKEEKYWWCKCYVKYKTNSHAYHQECLDYIRPYDETHL